MSEFEDDVKIYSSRLSTSDKIRANYVLSVKLYKLIEDVIHLCDEILKKLPDKK